MDAKSKANFINSVAAGQEIECPKCQTKNKANGKFCIGCGEKLEAIPAAPVENKTPFATIDDDKKETVVVEEKAVEAPVAAPVEKVVEKTVVYVEPESVFAQGLPEWSVEPPQVVVRRKRG